jgi:hypothetical protein
MRILPSLPATLLLLVPVSTIGGTIVVPDSILTVAQALASSSSGDTVLVLPGTYPERVTLVDGVILRGSDPVNRPVLSGGSGGAVIRAVSCSSLTRVEDFVVRRGAGSGLGGGASLEYSSVVFERCRFDGNSAIHGGGIGAIGSEFSAIGCEFVNNSASESGGGIALVDGPSPSITGCRLFSNDALAGGGVAVRSGSTPMISATLFDRNEADLGAAVWYDLLSGGSLGGCTLVFQQALTASGGALFFNALSNPTITQNIVAFTLAGGATFAVVGATPTFGCNDAYGNTGGDVLAGGIDLGTNFSADPQFCDAPTRDYTLQNLSPCLVGPCGQVGAFGAGGCPSVTVGEQRSLVTWAAMKSLYR